MNTSRGPTDGDETGVHHQRETSSLLVLVSSLRYGDRLAIDSPHAGTVTPLAKTLGTYWLMVMQLTCIRTPGCLKRRLKHAAPSDMGTDGQ